VKTSVETSRCIQLRDSADDDRLPETEDADYRFARRASVVGETLSFAV